MLPIKIYYNINNNFFDNVDVEYESSFWIHLQYK